MSEADVAQLRERLDNVIERLDDIKCKVERTNGRVTQLERWRLIVVTAVIMLALGGTDGLLVLLRMLGV
jgi:tetrahydromethanopterin S-methyltransferase subunit G